MLIALSQHLLSWCNNYYSSHSKWSKNFDERPHCNLVTPWDGESIRPTLNPIYYIVPWAHNS